MPCAKYRLEVPEPVKEVLRQGSVQAALQQFAGFANAQLEFAWPPHAEQPSSEPAGHCDEHPIRYRDDVVGRLVCTEGQPDQKASHAARAIGVIVERMLEREVAVTDLAEALMTTYEEVNLLYALLPCITAKTDPREIGQVLVEETAKTLGCRRVSLLVFDEAKTSYRVLAGVGLPPEAFNLTIPIADSVTGRALLDRDLLVIDNIEDFPELASASRGSYESKAFAVARVPVQARGESLGVLTVTERIEPGEFTARDRKLLESLSSIGASTLMNCQFHAAINKQMMSTIHALASAVDAKDKYTHDHAGRVAQLCVATAHELGVDDPGLQREVELAGLLHDIGKIGIPDAILSKPAALTPEEFRTIQKHTQVGAGIVEHVPGLEGVAKAILHHHERHDGLGYPAGLRGEDIPLASSLISVADTFDALTSDRPYRKAGSPEQALLELERCSGNQLKPDVVDAFVRVIRRELSNQQQVSAQATESSALLHPRPNAVVAENMAFCDMD